MFHQNIVQNRKKFKTTRYFAQNCDKAVLKNLGNIYMNCVIKFKIAIIRNSEKKHVLYPILVDLTNKDFGNIKIIVDILHLKGVSGKI
jgi:hypothetical protein